MKLKDFICLVSGILLVACIVGIVVTFKTNNSLCARLYLAALMSGTVFCLSAFRIDYGGRRRRNRRNVSKDIVITITEAGN